MSDKEALKTALRDMDNPDPKVRARGAAYLDHHADQSCVGPLTALLTDPSALVRRHAVHSLGCQHCKLVPLDVDIVGLLCERALEDTSIRVRRVSVHQLGLQPSDPRAAAALEQILQSDTDPGLLSRAEFALKNQLTGTASGRTL
jgi:HEAT repeat protein